MRFLTEDATILCEHKTGKVMIFTQQDLVTINGRKVLVAHDPRLKPITGCANVGPTIKPCTLTVNVVAGYSDFIRINGRQVCLDTITGLTDGTPPGVIRYSVRQAGQRLVEGEG